MIVIGQENSPPLPVCLGLMFCGYILVSNFMFRKTIENYENTNYEAFYYLFRVHNKIRI